MGYDWVDVRQLHRILELGRYRGSRGRSGPSNFIAERLQKRDFSEASQSRSESFGDNSGTTNNRRIACGIDHHNSVDIIKE